MAGGMFAGHDQCSGEVIEKNGKKFKLFYGMSSATAMQKHMGNCNVEQFFFFLSMKMLVLKLIPYDFQGA